MSHNINAGDPGAITDLQVKLSRLERDQERMKTVNLILRNHKGHSALTALREAGYSQEAAEAIMTPDYAGRVGYPPWTLQNNGSEIRRVKKRISELQDMASRSNSETRHTAFISGRDADSNRVWVSFDDKPDKPVCDILKRSGFKWAPSRSRWQRQWTRNAEHAHERIIRVLNELFIEAA